MSRTVTDEDRAALLDALDRAPSADAWLALMRFVAPQLVRDGEQALLMEALASEAARRADRRIGQGLPGVLADCGLHLVVADPPAAVIDDDSSPD